jgi:hypothetical protein
VFECRDPLGGPPLGAREQYRPLVRLGGRAPGEQLEERRLGAVGRARGRRGGPRGAASAPEGTEASLTERSTGST